MAQKDLITWNSVKPDFGASTYSFAQAGKALDSMTSGLSNLTDRISNMGKDMAKEAQIERENVLKQQGEAISNQALIDATDASGKFHQDRYATSIVKQQQALGIDSLNAVDKAKLQSHIDGNTTDQIQTNINLSADSREWDKHNLNKDQIYGNELDDAMGTYADLSIAYQNGEIDKATWEAGRKVYKNALDNFGKSGKISKGKLNKGMALYNLGQTTGEGQGTLTDQIIALGINTEKTKGIKNTENLQKQIEASNNKINEYAFKEMVKNGYIARNKELYGDDFDNKGEIPEDDIKALGALWPIIKAQANKLGVDLNTPEGQNWINLNFLTRNKRLGWGNNNTEVTGNKEVIELAEKAIKQNSDAQRKLLKKLFNVSTKQFSDKQVADMANLILADYLPQKRDYKTVKPKKETSNFTNTGETTFPQPSNLSPPTQIHK